MLSKLFDGLLWVAPAVLLLVVSFVFGFVIATAFSIVSAVWVFAGFEVITAVFGMAFLVVNIVNMVFIYARAYDDLAKEIAKDNVGSCSSTGRATAL